MKTEIIKLDINKIDADKLAFAADVIKNGGLVAFPTETVYGLGANALNEHAVKNIFIAKERPSDNPLIVHISKISSLDELVDKIPANAGLVMDRFWPGPITLVMKKSKIVPDIITGGLNTVALRMPSHPVALSLIDKAGIPVAAPSANTSGKPSPTCAKHVIDDLFDKVDVIIDAGNAEVGVESTVLDVTVNPPMILRPGGVTREQLESILTEVRIDPALSDRGISGNTVPRAPGMKYRHYSPKADVIIVEGDPSGVSQRINEMAKAYGHKGKTVGILATAQTKELYSDMNVISLGDRHNPETIAASLFYALREFDERGVDVIIAEAVKNEGIGFAIMNRMVKAAGYNIVKA